MTDTALPCHQTPQTLQLYHHWTHDVMERDLQDFHHSDLTIAQLYMRSKQCWVVLPQIWVKYGQTQMLG